MQRTYFFATGLRSISANKTGLSAHANESCQRWGLRISRLPSQLLILFFKPMLWSCRRFRRLPKAGGPTLLALSLEVQRDSIHDPPPGLRSLLLRVLNARRALKVPGSAISGWRLVSCPNGNRAARRRRDCRTTTHAHLAHLAEGDFLRALGHSRVPFVSGSRSA